MDKVTFQVGVDHPRRLWLIMHAVQFLPGLTRYQRKDLAFRLFDLARIHLVIDGKVSHHKWAK